MRKTLMILMIVFLCATCTGCSSIMESLFTDGGTAHEVAEQVTENAQNSSNPLIALLGAVGALALGYGTKTYTDKKKASTSKKGKK